MTEASTAVVGHPLAECVVAAWSAASAGAGRWFALLAWDTESIEGGGDLSDGRVDLGIGTFS